NCMAAGLKPKAPLARAQSFESFSQTSQQNKLRALLSVVRHAKKTLPRTSCSCVKLFLTRIKWREGSLILAATRFDWILINRYRGHRAVSGRHPSFLAPPAQHRHTSGL